MPEFDDTTLEVSAAQAAEALADGSADIIDVREQHEWDEGRIDGARLLPLGDLGAQAGTLDPERPVIFQCKSGGRSLLAAQTLRAAGYQAWSLRGGLQAWVDERRPIVPEDGRVADH